MLLGDELPATHPYRDATLRAVRDGSSRETAAHQPSQGGAIDVFVQEEIVKTNGNLYRHLHGRLPRYPIPALRLPAGGGRTLLDVGCNWGRWTFAAARNGYRAVGVDPWIEAARAGQRVARQLGLNVAFVVGDARQLPFLDGSFDSAFSYSVLQHFDKNDARASLAEMARVTASGGTLLVQMPNLLGLRQAYNFARQRLRRDQNPFRVRYWTHGELRRVFQELVGPSTLSVDGYFSLNPQTTDLDLLPPRYRCVIRASEALRRLSWAVPPLRLVADSLYVQSTNAVAFRSRLRR